MLAAGNFFETSKNHNQRATRLSSLCRGKHHPWVKPRKHLLWIDSAPTHQFTSKAIFLVCKSVFVAINLVQFALEFLGKACLEVRALQIQQIGAQSQKGKRKARTTHITNQHSRKKKRKTENARHRQTYTTDIPA
jgi:hypothetical protein